MGLLWWRDDGFNEMMVKKDYHFVRIAYFLRSCLGPNKRRISVSVRIFYVKEPSIICLVRLGWGA